MTEVERGGGGAATWDITLSVSCLTFEGRLGCGAACTTALVCSNIAMRLASDDDLEGAVEILLSISDCVEDDGDCMD